MKQIEEFGSHYNYDTTYMRELLDSSIIGYEKFANAMPLVSHREHLDLSEFWVAKLAAMRSEDCGMCLQLNVHMALEAGVGVDIVTAAIKNKEELPPELRDVYDFSVGVATNALDDERLIKRIETRFDKGQLLELGLSISTAKLFPTIKRAVGYTKSCSLIEVKIK